MPREAREQLILDVAGQVFARGGFHSAPMDEIADLAGVSKPMLYTYFGSKEGLYAAYIDRTGRELLERLLHAARPDDSPVDALHRRILEFLAFVEEDRDGWTVLFEEITSVRPLADEVAELRGQLAELPPHAADAVAHAIVGAGESLANWWLAHPEISRDQVTQWYAQVVQATIAAILRDAGTKSRR